MRDLARMMHNAQCLQLSPSLIAFQEKGRPPRGKEEESTSLRLRSLHDTYFYAHSFAPAYGRARATRIDEEWYCVVLTKIP